MSQNRIELLRDLYQAGHELRRAVGGWRVGQPVERLGLPLSPSKDVIEAIVKVEQAIEAIDETGMFQLTRSLSDASGTE